jgi:prepilin-type N-terminal cleavage/methylation domain-containing protein
MSAQKKGFTLIELLVTIAIIGILSVVGLISYSSVSRKSRDSRRAADIQAIQSALEVYRSNRASATYPASFSSSGFPSLFTTGSVPTDPKTHDPYNYDPEPNPCTDATCTRYSITYTTEEPVDTVVVHNP